MQTYFLFLTVFPEPRRLVHEPIAGDLLQLLQRQTLKKKKIINNHIKCPFAVNIANIKSVSEN
jgi:hypothetical protein